MQDKHH